MPLLAATDASPLGQHRAMKAHSCGAIATKEKTPFERFRPSYHFIAPTGWMNDPCAPGYDPATKLYHLSYQWVSNGVEWSHDIGWGHATSKDGVHWMHTEGGPILEPTDEYDCEGVFTGCFIHHRGEEDTTLTVVYTAVSRVALSWSLPYIPGTEKVAIATSSDGGRRWRKSPSNPLQIGPPKGMDVTGWRDPFIDYWPSLATVSSASSLAQSPPLIGLIAGGVRNVAPTIFLYTIDPSNLSDWSYVGLLVSPANARTYLKGRGRWRGDRGVNWECAGFLSLDQSSSKSKIRDVLIFGAEGGTREPLWHAATKGKSPTRVPRWSIWLAGGLSRGATSGTPEFMPQIEGVLDWGSWYAPQAWWDPVKQKRILWGWILEEDLPTHRVKTQAWAGLLSLPRELFRQTITNVISAIATPLADLPSFAFSLDPSSATSSSTPSTYTLETLGIVPCSDYQILRHRSRRSLIPQVTLSDGVKSRRITRDAGQAWELQATITFSSLCDEVGLVICHTSDFVEQTKIIFKPHSELIIVDRTDSTLYDDINVDPESGPHTLFNILSPSSDIPTLEPLRLHIFVDNSVLEIYANERFALSTRIYPSRGDATGISLFAEGLQEESAPEEGLASFEDVTLWSGISL